MAHVAGMCYAILIPVVEGVGGHSCLIIQLPKMVGKNTEQ